MKKVASTLLNILDDPKMIKTMDLSEPIQPVVDEMMSHWSYDLFSRKPGAAYTDDGVFVGTDLDLACFLFALADRGAVINLPEYTSRRQKQKTAGEVIVSKENRHGKILNVIANKETFSFSVRINDVNVMTTDSVGSFRNFMIVDIDGSWYDGWKTIEFVPSAKENDFLLNNKLWTGNTVHFKNFIHPNRWISFYGQYYFTTKVLIDRLDLEAKHLKTIATALREQGVKIGGTGGEFKEWPKKTMVGDSKSIKIKTLEAEVDYPEFNNEFPTLSNKTALKAFLPDYKGKCDSDLLKAVEDRARILMYTIIPKLRFATRATEYAFFFEGNDGLKMPKWIEDARWDRTYVLKGKKKIWSRLVFKRGIALRYRMFEKSEIVAAD